VGEGKAKSTHREVLESLAEQGDPEALAELVALPPLPRHGAHIWAWFMDLHATRQSNGMGPSRLSRLEIHAWEADEGHVLERWERKTLMAVDVAWVKAMGEQTAPKKT
jgi:hypothetical protein